MTIICTSASLVALFLLNVDETNAEKLFGSQILLNMEAHVSVSPKSCEASDWVERSAKEFPQDPERAYSLVVVVQITKDLIDAAIEYWSTDSQLAQQEKRDAKAKLTRQFIRKGERTFLLLVKPMAEVESMTNFAQVFGLPVEGKRSNWRFSVGPLAKKLKLQTLGDSSGGILRAEKSLDTPLDYRTKVESCLFYVKDVVNSEIDPTFSIVISDVKYYNRTSGRKWYETADPEKIRFRFETSEIGLMKMLNKGVPWSELERRFISPKRRLFDAGNDNFGVELVQDFAKALLIKLILRRI